MGVEATAKEKKIKFDIYYDGEKRHHRNAS